MRFLRRLILWLCFLGFLTAVGVPVFFWVRHTPRCTIDGWLRVEHLSADGRSLLATEFAERQMKCEEGDEPERRERTWIKILDTTTGQAVAAFDSSDQPLSANGRHFVHTWRGDTFVIDLDTREQWKLPAVLYECFSRDGKSLHVRDHDGPALVCLTSRVVVQRFDTEAAVYFNDRRSALMRACRNHLDIVDVNTGRTEQSLTAGIELDEGKYGLLSSPNDRWFALCTSGNRFIVPELRFGILTHCMMCELWDRSLRRRIVSFGDIGGEPLTVMFSEDSGSAAMWRRSNATLEFVLVDLALSKVTKFSFSAHPREKRRDDEFVTPHGWGRFSPDGSHFLLSHWNSRGYQLTAFDLKAGCKAWEREGPELVLFGSERTCLVATQGIDQRLEILDIGSGQTRARLSPELAFDYEQNHDLAATAQRSIALRTLGQPIKQVDSWRRRLEQFLPGFREESGPRVAVVDLETGREQFRLNQSFYECRLSKDRSTLATIAWLPGAEGAAHASHVQIWNVNRHTAWFWAVMSSLLTGATLLLLRRWRQTRRPRPQASAGSVSGAQCPMPTANST